MLLGGLDDLDTLALFPPFEVAEALSTGVIGLVMAVDRSGGLETEEGCGCPGGGEEESNPGPGGGEEESKPGVGLSGRVWLL